MGGGPVVVNLFHDFNGLLKVSFAIFCNGASPSICDLKEGSTDCVSAISQLTGEGVGRNAARFDTLCVDRRNPG